MSRAPSIRLVPLSRADLAELIEDLDEFATTHAVQLGAMREATVDVADQSARFYDSANVDAPWGLTSPSTTSGAQVVGVCSFKGPPNKDRAVENRRCDVPGLRAPRHRVGDGRPTRGDRPKFP